MSGCKTCGCALGKQNVSGYCRAHSNVGRASERVKPEPRRCHCGVAIGAKNKTGMCLKHVLEKRNNDPVEQAARAKALRARFAQDPELREAHRKRAFKLHQLPQSKAAKLARYTPDFQRAGVEAMQARPDLRKLAGERSAATRLAWCPPHLRDEYRHLSKAKGFSTVEARRMIEDQHELEMARWRRSIGVAVESEEIAVPEPAAPSKDRPQDEAFALATRLFDVTEDEILSPARDRRIMLPRYALAVALQRGGFSTPSIAGALNRGDHSTAINLLRKASELIKRDRAFAAKVERIAACWPAMEAAA